MRTVVVICVITVSAFIGPPVWAGLVGGQYQHDPYLVHDQYQTSYDVSYGTGGPTQMAQTFTAGQTGILDHIDIGNLTGVSFDPVVAPVIQIQGSQPGSTPLASVTLSAPLLLDGWTLCIEPLDDRGQKISVTAGTMYSIVLWASDQLRTVPVGATIDDSYDRGALWATDEAGTWWQLNATDFGVSDMQFQTYVVPVPLPAGVWLGIFAVSVAGWHLKRQRA